MEIKRGSIEYFGLLDFQDMIKSQSYDKFGLMNLDRLRLEVEIKIKAIVAKDLEDLPF